MSRADVTMRLTPKVSIKPPADTPDYMHGAWAAALSAALGQPEILAQFRADTGNNWKPARSGINRMIDEATGADRTFVEQFVAWFNENVWGPMEGP